MHSRPQSLRFFWSRGRRNGGLWWQQLPDVRKSRTSGNACVLFARLSAHAQKLILRGGERGIKCVVDSSKKREQNSALNAVAEHSIASLSNFLPTGLAVHFVVDRIRTVNDRKQCSNLLFLLFMFDILDVIRLSMTRQNLFMNTQKLSWNCITDQRI